MSVFGTPKLVDTKTADWVFDRFEWILESFGLEKAIRETTLVLPAPGYFVVEDTASTEVAQTLYNQTATYCGVGDWPVNLVAIERNAPRNLGHGTILQPSETKSAAGSFSLPAGSNTPTISYASDLAAEPSSLIATFAHEIGHLLMAGKPLPDWMADGEEELVTDLIAVYLGFGVFLANSAFQFEQSSHLTQQGWSSRTQGYLSEDTLLFGLAVFASVQATDPELIAAHLKPGLRKRFGKAWKQVGRFAGKVEILVSLDDRRPPSTPR